MTKIDALEEGVGTAASVHQIRADSAILGPLNKLLGKHCSIQSIWFPC